MRKVFALLAATALSIGAAQAKTLDYKVMLTGLVGMTL